MIFDLKHTFVTSDHHFGSARNPNPFRVFTEDEEQELIQKWNSVVRKNDIVIYNGDFHDCGFTSLVDYINKLNGNKILVKGNHDYLGNDIYEILFNKVYDELTIDNLNGLVVRHVPDLESNKPQIYGHFHTEQFKKLDPSIAFCSCVMRHDGYPIRLDEVAKQLKLQTCQEDC